jgi:hypothetical protein
MKRIAVVGACVAALVAGSSCNKGTLVPSGSGGQTGTGTVLDGIGGNGPVVTGGAASGGNIGGDPGVGGDGVSPPGGNTGTGRGGRGGTGFVTCPPPLPPVCGALCGNGRIDTCQAAVAPECLLTSQAEECDGDNFGGDGCTVRGYGSGTFTCSSACTVDTTTCSDCMPTSGVVASCGPAPITFPALNTFAIAANDNEVGLAQIDYSTNTGSSRLTFARLDAKLALTGAVGLEDTGQPGPLQGQSIDTVAVAATPSGWLVAACGGSNIFVHVLDSNGKKVARTVVSASAELDFTAGCQYGTLSLSAAPTGGALLMWGTYYNNDAVAAVIAADGLSASTPRLLGDPAAITIGAPAGAWTGDAYTIALPVELESNGYPVVARLMRVTVDGTVTKVADVLKDEFSQSPTLAAGATDIRLIYGGVPPGSANYDFSVMTRRIGPAGEILSAPLTLGSYPYYGRSPAAAFGSDTVVLLSGSQTELLSVVRADASGNIVSRNDVAVSPEYTTGRYDMVRRGKEVVVAWIKAANVLMLARVAP